MPRQGVCQHEAIPRNVQGKMSNIRLTLLHNLKIFSPKMPVIIITKVVNEQINIHNTEDKYG